jgi:6-pyruvoyltetrahydropterin/6-carboxytetrahydropterin synthase
MITITKILEWDSGHRVLGHEGKCKHLHGHRYKAEIAVTAPELDNLGRVIDFGVIKKEVGNWIDTHWDHNLLINSHDPLNYIDRSVKDWIHSGKDPYIFDEINPTAENMAKILYAQAAILLHHYQITVIRVRLWETPTSFADCTPPHR